MTLRTPALLAAALATAGCEDAASTHPPPEGWANSAPTTVDAVVDRGDEQLLEVRQGALSTWVQVPNVGAQVGDFVLLGRGTVRTHVPIPERATRAAQVVDIDHVRVVDEATARRAVVRQPPANAVSIGDVYAEHPTDTTVVVYGRVVKAATAVGSTWVHLQDGTGDAATGTHDLTVQTQDAVVEGQWAAFTGTLRRDVNLGFGYHYDALVEAGTRLDSR